jgi:hypothetical protein
MGIILTSAGQAEGSKSAKPAVPTARAPLAAPEAGAVPILNWETPHRRLDKHSTVMYH